MSRGGRRRRGSGGHPARVAERRARGESRRSASVGAAGLARDIARSAAELGSALDVELWGSHMLGTFWRGRYELPFEDGVGIDPALEYGEPLLAQLARIDEPGAAIAMLAIAELEEGELGLQAKELLDSRNLWRRLPHWAGDVGESAIVGAAVMRDPIFDDARTVFLESRHPDGRRIAVGVLIDNNLGRMAKDVLLAESIDQVVAVLGDRRGEAEDALELERIEPGVAAGMISAAIRLTDMTWDPPVADGYWPGRAVALLRADQTPGAVAPEDPEEMPVAAREALRDEFLAASEGAAFAADSDQAWVATLAIDYAAGYLGGDPLRWSPSVVELFLLDWLPRKVITTPEMLAALPDALDAWVRFAGRRRGIGQEYVVQAQEAVVEFCPQAVELAADADVAGPSKRFLTAAMDAGVDIQDPDALEGFVAGFDVGGGGLAEPGVGAASEARTASGVRAASGGRATGPGSARVLQLKVSLNGVTKPPVWRRLQVPANTRLDELHQIIQVTFGWEDYHLHMFEAGREEFGPADDDLELDCADERKFTLEELAAEEGDRIRYTYDFGDHWVHEIVVEAVLEPDSDHPYPRLVTGRGACPPEDCGGVWGYEELKHVLTDPAAEDHGAAREGARLSGEGPFDPAALDLEAIRARLTAWRQGPGLR